MRDIRYSVICLVSCVVMLIRFQSCSALRKYSVVTDKKFPKHSRNSSTHSGVTVDRHEALLWY